MNTGEYPNLIKLVEESEKVSEEGCLGSDCER